MRWRLRALRWRVAYPLPEDFTKRLAALLAGLALALVGCPSPPGVSATGTWQGTFAVTGGATFYVQAILNDADGAITGTTAACADDTFASCGAARATTGTRANASVTLTVPSATPVPTATGTISGSTLSGTWAGGSAGSSTVNPFTLTKR